MKYFIIDIKGDVYAETDSKEKAEALLVTIIEEHPEYRDLELEILEPEYRIKPEYLDEWGEDVTADYIITQDELEWLARQWDKSIDELLEQLEEVDD